MPEEPTRAHSLRHQVVCDGRALQISFLDESGTPFAFIHLKGRDAVSFAEFIVENFWEDDEIGDVAGNA